MSAVAAVVSFDQCGVAPRKLAAAISSTYSSSYKVIAWEWCIPFHFRDSKSSYTSDVTLQGL